MVPQARESGNSVGRGGVVLHGAVRPKPASVDSGPFYQAGGETVGSQRGLERAGNDEADA